MSTSDITTNGVSSTDPDALRAEIERTRDNLSRTVDALHAKLDVKSQARAKVAQVRERATTDSGQPRPEVLAGAAGVLALVAGLVWWRKR